MLPLLIFGESFSTEAEDDNEEGDSVSFVLEVVVSLVMFAGAYAGSVLSIGASLERDFECLLRENIDANVVGEDGIA